MQTLHSLAVQRAAAILGGEPALAVNLGVTEAAIALWLQGTAVPPTKVFLQITEIIGEQSLCDLSNRVHAQNPPGDSP